jgi:pullulanase
MKKTILPLFVLSTVILAGCGGGISSLTSTNDSASETSENVCPTEENGTSLPDQASTDVNLPALPTSFTEPTLVIHFRRNDAQYKNYGLWLWVPGVASRVSAFNYQDKFGVAAAYPLSDFANVLSKNLGLIVVKGTIKDGDTSWGSDWSKDYGNDRIIDLNTIDKESNGYNLYLLSGDGEIYTSPSLAKKDTITNAKFTAVQTIAFETNKLVSGYTLKENGTVVKSETGLCATKGTIALGKDGDPTAAYVLDVTFKTSGKIVTHTVSASALYKLVNFDAKWAYDGADLGANYSAAATTFKVWSPVSSALRLNLYEKGSSSEAASAYETHAMVKGDKGVWSVSVTGDLAGKYYTYSVSNSSYSEKEIVDPYAKACGLNGQRGMVVDFSKTNPTGWDAIAPKAVDKKALTVWETHVADVTSSGTWNGTEAKRKKYLGLIEGGTTYTSSTYANTVKTGFDHIKELGVNAVQLLPIFDQDNDETNPSFNWGYNPLNYNCLEGVYSSDPKDGYARIKEFKQVVQGFNEAGINIVMDVVYNHVSSALGSNFDVLMPGYYYRYNADGTFSNGSGCGNETASDMAMYRKFMIDSTAFWASEYKLGGFRFDLMGLHDLETMKEVSAKLKTINPTIAVYGEPWTGGTTTLASDLQAKQANGNSFVGYGAFNDGMRDALIKGGLHAASEQGWVTDASATSAKDVETIIAGIKGTTANNGVTIADPDKTVNYVTCHDNYTLKDRMTASGGVSSSGAVLAKANVVANSFPLLSQGTSFLLAGDEFNRSKGGSSNSYNASYEVNMLDYALKSRFYDSIFTPYTKLIALKKTVDGLHLSATNAANVDVTSLAGGAIIKQVFKDSANKKEYVAYHCNGTAAVTSATIDLSGYSLYMDSQNLSRSGSFAPAKYEVVIGVKDLA